MNIICGWSKLFLAGLAVLLFSSPAFAQTTQLSQDNVLNSDYFAAGDTVTVSGVVNGDAYITGGTIIIDGTINGDAMLAGGNITINGEITQDLRVAGGDITINGPVKRNLTVAGGDVQIGKSGAIAGNVLGLFGNLELYGSVIGNSRLMGGQAMIDGPIGGSVDAKVGKLALGETANISGNLTYTSEEHVEMAPMATIAGTVQYDKSSMKWDESSRRKVGEDIAKAWAGFKTGAAIIDFIGAAIIGLLLLRLLPNRMLHMTEIIRDHPVKAWLIGFATLVLAPMVFFFLMITIVGIPLSMLLLFGLLAFYFFAKIPVVYFVGRYVTEKMNNGDRRGWAFISGLLLYILVTMLPIIGFIAKLITLPLGIGTLLLEKKYFYHLLQEKKLI